MGILLAAMAAAGDQGVKSIDQNIDQQNKLGLQNNQSALETAKAKALVDYQKQASLDMDDQKRKGAMDRVSAMKDQIIKDQLASKYADSDSAVQAAANGQTGSQLTPEQLAVIAQSKSLDSAQLSHDPHTTISAATATGDITPHEVASLAMQEDSIKRSEAAQKAQFDHADASQERSQNFMALQQSRQMAATAALTHERLSANAPDPDSIKAMAQLVADGDATLGKRDPDRSDILAAAKKINPDYNEGDAAASYHAKTAFATGKQGEQVKFQNNALEHLNTLKQMAAALQNKNMVVYNKVANFLAKQTGNPDVTNFDVARNLVGQEVVKAIVPGAGGEGERKTAADAFSKDGAPAQILGAANTYTSLLSTQLHGMQQQYVASNPVFVNHPEKSDFARYLGANARVVTGIKPPVGKPDNWGLANTDSSAPVAASPASGSTKTIDFGTWK